MIELLILQVLLDEKFTIYKIKQRIEKKYGFFLNISFGSIHPAVKRLENQKCIYAKKSVTEGGQRSSVYSITDSGKAYFIKLMLDDLPDNPSIAKQLINIKLLSFNKLEDKQKIKVKDSIINYLEMKKTASNYLLSSGQDLFTGTELKFLNYNIQRQNEFVEWIKLKI
ncbi:MAG: PadR family transcriptional regulator [Candidatus Gastranaerophilales bacterium]|nr:PadR family transcriptional regulator [Candidatus Gastranaerophilales bacterium]